MQKRNVSKIDVTESVETTEQNYEWLLKIFCKNENNVLEILPTLKDMTNIIEEND